MFYWMVWVNIFRHVSVICAWSDKHFRTSRGTKGTARSGTGTFRPPQADFFLGLLEQRYGKTFPFVYRGMGTGRKGGKAEG